jgi:GGDEF domain-containing protein/CBS domain-containing protein
MARAAGSHVIAEGVETLAEASELRDAGVSFLQGFYIAHPNPEPCATVSATIIQRVKVNEAPKAGRTALDLIAEVETVGPDASVGHVAEFLHQQPGIQVLPVIADGKPIGLIRRSELLDLLSLPLRHELYGRKPISFVMDKRPLLVESDLRLEQVSRLVTRGNQERLHEQFVVTRKGKYLGMARVIDLLRHITEEQIKSARYSNPLTSLPGNVPIYDCVNGLLRRQRAFVLCYADIDNFKPFNDFYGYSKGDEALMLFGRELRSNARPRIDFVGHVGGDDFVIVFRSPDWQERITRAMAAIESRVRDLYHPEHLQRGGIAISRQQVGLLNTEFERLDLAPARARVEAMPDERRGGFLAIRAAGARAIAQQLRERGVHADARRDLIRVGPAPYLRDDQLRYTIAALGETLSALGSRF